MNLPTAQEISSIIVFLAPGYIIRLIYRSKFSAKERSETHQIITSVAYSFPVVAMTTLLVYAINAYLKWRWSPRHHLIIHIGDPYYVLIATMLAIGLAFVIIGLRENETLKSTLEKWGFRGPETDLYAKVFKKYHDGQRFTTTLKSGTTFRGYIQDARANEGVTPAAIYFRGVEWWSKSKKKFVSYDDKETVLLVALEEIEYMETIRLP